MTMSWDNPSKLPTEEEIKRLLDSSGGQRRLSAEEVDALYKMHAAHSEGDNCTTCRLLDHAALADREANEANRQLGEKVRELETLRKQLWRDQADLAEQKDEQRKTEETIGRVVAERMVLNRKVKTTHAMLNIAIDILTPEQLVQFARRVVEMC